MAGSEVAITVESMFSMNSATATISGTTRSFSFGGMRGLLAFRRAGFLKPLQTVGRLLEFRVELERLAEIGVRAVGLTHLFPDQTARGERARRMVIEFDSAIGVAERLGAFAGKVMRPGAVVIGQRRVRRQRDGKRVVDDRRGEVEPLALGIAAVDIGVGQTRIEFYRLIEIGERAVKLALGGPGAAAIVVGRGRRIELDRLVVVGNGAAGIAFVVIGIAAIVVGDRELRVEPDRRLVIGDGAVEIALLIIGIAAL